MTECKADMTPDSNRSCSGSLSGTEYTRPAMGWYTIACRDNDPPPLNAGPGIAYGVDGCGAGWFGYGLTNGGERRYRIALTFEELVSSADNGDRFFVDIPIGLPRGSEEHLCGKEGSKVRPCCDPKACEVRRCDKDARDALGSPRSRSVFSAPVCAALYAKTYEDANRISREVSRKGMSKQTFALLPKIREVDSLLRESEKTRRIVVREVHPEICFWALAGRKAMKHSKKKPDGFHERLDYLNVVLPSADSDFEEIRDRFPKRILENDDILDAMAAAVTASADDEVLRRLPGGRRLAEEEAPRDCCCLPMEMVYWLRPCAAT